MLISIQIIDRISKQILFQCPISEIETAYQKAQEYEEMGLDVKLEGPGLTESLILSLGATEDEIKNYKSGLVEEINAHNDEFGDERGCAACLITKN